ncbi:unnamed protein product [Dimorphilus gyrociliatus]|uniref:Uncharacterized protein n=1 Tax=Dimorphilus gyrociliatus TaxID=2664684 RepID=A0A7I8VPN8_9ANNE|nr:unnamed protein product [Dimorphilus gyrociliatus]
MANEIWIPLIRNKYQRTCVYSVNKTKEQFVDVIYGSIKNFGDKEHLYQDYQQYADEVKYKFAVCSGSTLMKDNCCVNKVGCCNNGELTVQISACILVVIVLLVIWLWICQLYILKRHLDDLMNSQKKTFLIGHLPVGQRDLSKPPQSEENLYCLPDLPKSKASKTNPLESSLRQAKSPTDN